MMWFCRVALKLLWCIASSSDVLSPKLIREYTDIERELDDKLWPGGKPPEAYED
jgi:hypothetical protein